MSIGGGVGCETALAPNAPTCPLLGARRVRELGDSEIWQIRPRVAGSGQSKAPDPLRGSGALCLLSGVGLGLRLWRRGGFGLGRRGYLGLVDERGDCLEQAVQRVGFFGRDVQRIGSAPVV